MTASTRQVRDDRIRCINPRCRITAPADGRSTEIICGRCWRSLPRQVRDTHNAIERRRRRVERLIARIQARGDDDPNLSQQALSHAEARVWASWREIRLRFEAPAMPDGLEAFLEDMGLAGPGSGSSCPALSRASTSLHKL
jgi:hypothetical protein